MDTGAQHGLLVVDGLYKSRIRQNRPHGWRHPPLAAHRVMWERRRGPIPPGMYLDHTCRTRPCINPDHLRVVTPYVNTIENSRSVSALNTVKTHCPRGHPYAGYNLSVYQIKRTGRTGRYCKTCMRDRWRNRHAQIKGVL